MSFMYEIFPETKALVADVYGEARKVLRSEILVSKTDDAVVLTTERNDFYDWLMGFVNTIKKKFPLEKVYRGKVEEGLYQPERVML